MTGIVHFALAIAPYAVPAMIYSVIVKIGWDIVVALGVFVAGCVFVLLLHLFGTMSLWLEFLAKRNPLETFKLMRPVLATAFSTSSSAASAADGACRLARAARRARAGGGIRAVDRHDDEHSGSALYEGCVVLFIAQVFGIELGLAQQVTLRPARRDYRPSRSQASRAVRCR